MLRIFEKSWSLAVAVTVIVGATADIAVVVVTAAVIAFLVTSVGVAVAPILQFMIAKVWWF